MSDLISRQAAINAFWSLDVELRPSTIDTILNTLNGLPSVQPEITKRTAETEQNVSNGDLISRKAAIEALESIGSVDTEADKEFAIEIFEALPSVQEQRWIPVTERLPEKHGAYLVYDKEEVLMGYYSTFDRDWTGMNGFPLVNVIAWMPLPEPWKGEEDEPETTSTERSGSYQQDVLNDRTRKE